MKTKLNHIEVGGVGFGQATQADIDRRALELAISDGRERPNDIDFVQARQEFGALALDAEDPADEILETDRPGDGFPAAGAGIRAARSEFEDEATLAETLVEEGVAEAEHDSRLHSDHGQ
jgi:hypothetical protein